MTGALAGSVSDYGISDDFMRDLAKRMTNDSSALFMLVRRATVDKVAPEIARFGGTLLHTSVSKAMEERFRTMLAENAGHAAPAAPDSTSTRATAVAE